MAPLADLTTRNFLVARSTMPRWTASVVWRYSIWLNVRIGAMSANAVIDRDDVLELLNASVSASCSLIVWWKLLVYPADSTVVAVALPPWLAASATTPAAPPPTSTAAATARRAVVPALRMPRLLRSIIAASFGGRRPPCVLWFRWA